MYVIIRENIFKTGILSLLFSCSLFISGCHSDNTLFQKISSRHSGIHFNNAISENDSINPIDLEFMYNGGGVAVGDFNNDGLPDLYFTGSLVSNRLYLNKGNFEFDDITQEANVSGEGRWSNGASVVDINNDGWLDIYVCVTIKKNPIERTNLLYVNQGLDKNGVPVFKEMAREYGLADTGYSVQAAFFDFDNDGDLDMYLLNTKLGSRDVDRFSGNDAVNDKTDVDKLYRNDWNDSLHHPVFTDVSKSAGILQHGYGLGVAIADMNNDGWKDIYVSNDFFGSDVLYINNHNGTFSNKISECIKHTSQSSMGNDIADINNDGLPDLMTVDMDPPDNLRKKKNMGAGNYNIYQNMLYGNYTLQYSRNTLQLNRGPKPLPGDSVGEPIFSDIGLYAGVAETDWSWNPSLADFDNDGYRDIMVTNGYPKDVTDHDFAAFRRQSSSLVSKEELLDQIPQIRISNYAFKNNGDLTFKNVTKSWGLESPSFSNGAVYVDLDNDGDLDYVVNNINDEAFLYENTLNSKQKINANYLDIRFIGNKANVNGLGAWAGIYYDHGRLQTYENSPYRGYLSTVEAKGHFGLGSTRIIDSVVIKWPTGEKQVLTQIGVNRILVADIKNASHSSIKEPSVSKPPLFSDITSKLGVKYFHLESDHNDFASERLLPHKLSQYGPGLAVADVDQNGLDDIFIGGSSRYPGKFLLQQTDGSFIEKPLPVLQNFKDQSYKNMGILLFDANGDGYPDLYCANGSNEFISNSKNYQDIFLVNDGKGNFSLDTAALPVNLTSKSCLKAADFDNDTHPDLFIGGRVLPGRYPMPVSSFIYHNDSKSGHTHFTDVTSDVAPELKDIGMVCDALWTDYDNDGWMDLIVVGEWMPITIFHNDHGKLKKINGTGLDSAVGWWNSIVAGDFDNDGDIDYIVGNLGQNSFFRATDARPVSVYAADFDNNKNLDAITTLFLPNEKDLNEEFPASSRDEIMGQLPGLKKNFLTYKEFGQATINDLFSAEQLKVAKQYHANEFRSMYIENLGNGKFKMHALPPEAQLAPLYGMVVDDFNQDGNLDVAVAGNDYGTDVTNGRYDAMNGLVLLGDGKGNLRAQSILQSGLFIPGDAKALVKLADKDGNYLLAGSQNKNILKIFKANIHQHIIRLRPGDLYALFTLANGKTRKEEVYRGSSFLSQSSGFIIADAGCKKIEIYNELTGKRIVP
jgi:enediyne biosynthesis protein E4